jgi:hypothetical protein
MKRLFFYPAIACIFMLNTASMCSSDDDNSYVPTAQQAAIAAINSTVAQGTWHITNFSEDTVDHTAQFSGYNFTFGGASVLTANNGTNNYTGVWSVTNSDGSDDDNPSGDIDFNIAFTTPANFAELTEDWHILERTATLVRLQHVSGGNGGTDLLTFEKN